MKRLIITVSAILAVIFSVIFMVSSIPGKAIKYEEKVTEARIGN